MKAIIITLFLCLVLQQATDVSKKSDRAQDGLVGPAKQVFEEWSPISGYRSEITPGTRCRTRTSIYDLSGRLTQSSVYMGSCGSDEHRNYYTYDKDGNRMSRAEEIQGVGSQPPPPPPMQPPGAKGDQNLQGPSKTVFKYDPQERKSEAVTIRANGALIYKIVYKYDEKDRLQESVRIDSDGKITSEGIYSYEGDKRFPARYVNVVQNGRITHKVTYTDYELNAQGDWIKRKKTAESSDGSTTVSLEYRSIEYHPSPK